MVILYIKNVDTVCTFQKGSKSVLKQMSPEIKFVQAPLAEKML